MINNRYSGHGKQHVHRTLPPVTPVRHRSLMDVSYEVRGEAFDIEAHMRMGVSFGSKRPIVFKDVLS